MTEVSSLVDEAIVIDAHDHTLDYAFRDGVQIDTAGMRAGGVTAGIFALEIAGASTDGCGPKAKEHPFHALMKMLDYFHEWVKAKGDLMMVTSASDIERAKDEGKVAAILGLEGGDPLNHPYSDVESLRMLHRLGLRHILLVHEGQNDLGTSVQWFSGLEADPRVRPGGWREYDPGTDGPGGLTPAGKKIVREMNHLGMIIDVSHLTEPDFWDVLELSEAPVIASHSNPAARSDCLRNLTDDQLVALARKGGVVGVTGAPMCETDVLENRTRSLDDVIDDIDYLAELIGLEHVGLGTDHGKGSFVLGDRSTRKVADIVPHMLEHSYDDQDIKGVLGGNFLRVFKTIMA